MVVMFNATFAMSILEGRQRHIGVRLKKTSVAGDMFFYTDENFDTIATVGYEYLGESRSVSLQQQNTFIPPDISRGIHKATPRCHSAPVVSVAFDTTHLAPIATVHLPLGTVTPERVR